MKRRSVALMNWVGSLRFCASLSLIDSCLFSSVKHLFWFAAFAYCSLWWSNLNCKKGKSTLSPLFRSFIVCSCRMMFVYWLADYSSCWRDNKGLGEEGLWGDNIRWCRSFCVQLCLLPLTEICRTEQDLFTLCSRSSFRRCGWGDSDEIHCFSPGGTHFCLQVMLSQLWLILVHESWTDLFRHQSINEI